MSIKLHQITPNIMTADVSKSVKFYTNLFGLEIEYLVRQGGENDEGFDTEVDDNKVYQYAGLSKDGFKIGIQEKLSFIADVKETTDKTPGTFSGDLYFEVDDLEAIKEKLDDSDFRELETTWYGMKEVYLKDPDGYVICIAAKDENFSMV